MQKLLGPARTPHANSAKTQNDVIMSLIIKPHHINNYYIKLGLIGFSIGQLGHAGYIGKVVVIL